MWPRLNTNKALGLVAVVSALAISAGIMLCWMLRAKGPTESNKRIRQENQASGLESEETQAEGPTLVNGKIMVGEILLDDLIKHRRQVATEVANLPKAERREYLLSDIGKHRGKDLMMAAATAELLMDESRDREDEWRGVFFDILKEWFQSREAQASLGKWASFGSCKPVTVFQLFAFKATRYSPRVAAQAIDMMASETDATRAAGACVIHAMLMRLANRAVEAEVIDSYLAALRQLANRIATKHDIPPTVGRWVTCGGRSTRVMTWLEALKDQRSSDQRKVLDWLVKGGCLSEDPQANRKLLSLYAGTELERDIEKMSVEGAKVARAMNAEAKKKR